MSEPDALLRLIASFFDDLGTMPGLWSEEFGQHMVSKQAIEDLANRYADQAAALARSTQDEGEMR